MHRAAQLLGDGDRGRRLEAGQQHGELVAAGAGQQPAVAEAVAQGGGDRLEHLVAGLVAAGVVDVLEVVDVDGQDAERLPAGFCQGLLELGAPQQPGERVADRRLGEPLVAHRVGHRQGGEVADAVEQAHLGGVEAARVG